MPYNSSPKNICHTFLLRESHSGGELWELLSSLLSVSPWRTQWYDASIGLEPPWPQLHRVWRKGRQIGVLVTMFWGFLVIRGRVWKTKEGHQHFNACAGYRCVHLHPRSQTRVKEDKELERSTSKDLGSSDIKLLQYPCLLSLGSLSFTGDAWSVGEGVNRT